LADGDPEIGRFIADAMKRIGNEGLITIEEAKSRAGTLWMLGLCCAL
jgi:chaperonin GroEL